MNKKTIYFDIAANLSDSQFSGIYHGKKKHEPDHEYVIQRARDFGVEYFLFASGNMKDVEQSLKLCDQFQGGYTTVGIHPCHANDILKDEQKYYQKMEQYLDNNKGNIVAIGECGLDYDRFHYSDKQTQHKAFPIHFDWAEKYKLPMYLHSRNCTEDFIDIVSKNRDRFSNGVVHSYTGDEKELQQLLDMDLYIGVNGCSLKTQQNIDVVKKIPLDKIMLETDCPYCEIRNTHASKQYVGDIKWNSKRDKKYQKGYLVKGRNEPCKIIEISKVVSNILGIDENELCKQALENSLKLFNINTQKQFMYNELK